jgi:hypothetical protein
VTPIFGQAWLTARGLTGGLLLASVALVFVGVMLFTARVFWHWPVSTRPGYYQWERGLVTSGFVAQALGLAALGRLLHESGDPLFADLGLTAFTLGAGVLILVEVAWLAKADLPDRITGAWMRAFVVVFFVAHTAYGAALLQTGLLPGWLGWTTVIWNVGWLVVLFRARDPYYPVLHFELPVLAGILLLVKG